MTASTALFNPSLESVQQAFDHWRITRQKRSHTPISLRRRAAALCHAHPASHICQALRINDTALRNWRNEFSPVPVSTAECKPGVVELPPVPTAPAELSEKRNHPTPDIRIDIGNAVVLHIQGSFSLEQILSAVRSHQQGECA